MLSGVRAPKRKSSSKQKREQNNDTASIASEGHPDQSIISGIGQVDVN